MYCMVLSLTDQVLEKAMHKCVLKPLKSIIEVILHDFQVRHKLIPIQMLYLNWAGKEHRFMLVI